MRVGAVGVNGFDLYKAIGGTGMCRKLSEAFYARVADDPVLRPLFPGKTFKCAIEEFSAFLVQLLGGPSEHAQRRWWLSLRESHLRFKIGQSERDAWIRAMKRALDDVEVGEPVQSTLLGFFEKASAYLVNTGPRAPGDTDDKDCSAESKDRETIRRELADRWAVQLALDEAVKAIRNDQTHLVLGLAESSPLQSHLEINRSVLANLLGLMIDSGSGPLLNYVHRSLVADPALVRERYRGRTLLHEASAAGNLELLNLLLQLGADPNSTDSGGHAPLYSVANECTAETAGRLVKLLVLHGARVNACDGVKRCTALHMAARRGKVDTAKALLECGADIEARDSTGDTPLRRAVNCGKTAIAELLLSRGADMYSKGSRSLTPVLAARTAGMSRLLGSPRG